MRMGIELVVMVVMMVCEEGGFLVVAKSQAVEVIARTRQITFLGLLVVGL